jgi:8-oxo-dGTP pyrophosphatase MutT (NUDIX family)
VAEPVVARPSASVILVRDAEAGLETFMVRRHERSHVAPSAFVFPGGTVRADDVLPEVTVPDLRSNSPLRADDARALYVAAVRELFEEAGVLLACDATGALLQVDDADLELQEHLAAARLTMQAHAMSLRDLLDEYQWRPAYTELVPFSHWVTPDLVPVRFDTRFFVARMPPRQNALHCAIETSEGAWLRPVELLDRSYPIVFPTEQHLRRVAPFATVAELLTFARTKAIKRVQPRLHEGRNGRSITLDPSVLDSW